MTDTEADGAQPGLFDGPSNERAFEDLVRFALGEFQSRGFILAGRKMALDRLLGAFRRAFEEFQLEPLTDGEIAERLREAGASVEELPSWVAKHPYRITIGRRLAKECLEYFEAIQEKGTRGH